MSPAPSADLNIHVGHESILQSAKVPVKSHLPSSTTCPLCRLDLLHVYVAPKTGGRWYTCRNCLFRGDSIELYQAMRKIPSIVETVYALNEEGLMAETFSDAAIEEYEKGFVKRRATVNRLVENSKHELYMLPQPLLQLLQEYHLWDGYKAGHWRKQLGRYLGGSTAKQLRKYDFEVPKEFSVCLVVPYYDVPGRVSSILLLGRNGSTHRIYALTAGLSGEDGLMMLDSVNLHDEFVIAVGDPLFALHLQRKHFNTSLNPMKMVVFGEGTHWSWQSINARRVIYWDNKTTYSIYNHSRYHPRAHIAAKPRFPDKSTNFYMKGTTVPEMLSTLKNSAKSWAESLKEFLLTQDEWRVIEAIRNLQLSAQETNRIYDLCTPEERFRVRQLLGESTYERYVYVNNLKIAEGDDGWWIIRKDGQRELGCSAIIRINRVIHLQDGDQNLYDGEIITSKGTIEFSDAMDYVDKKTGDWLNKTMMRGGLGSPTIQQRLRPHLITIAKQLHEPHYVQSAGRVGWNQDMQAFLFPNFGVRNGAIDGSIQAMVTSTDMTPAASLYSASIHEGDWGGMREDTNESAALWCGLSAFMHNLIAPVIGATPLAIGFVGGIGSVAGITGAHLAEELGAVSMNSTKTTQPLRAVRQHLANHGYPCWVDYNCTQRSAMQYISASEADNTMAQLTSGEATCLAVGRGWVFIRAPMTCMLRGGLPSLRGAARFLAYLQANDFQLPPATGMYGSILDTLKSWIEAETGEDYSAVFKSAWKMLLEPESLRLDRRLLHLIFWLRSGQKLNIDHRQFYSALQYGPIAPGHHILIDDESKKVYVELNVVRKIVRKLKLPVPDIDAAIQVMVDDSDGRVGFEPADIGLVVNLDYWNTEAKYWRKLHF